MIRAPFGAAVDQTDRDRGQPGADRKLFGAAGSVPDDLPDEFMAEHDVAGSRRRASGP